MRLRTLLLFLTTCMLVYAKLPYKLPPKAEYTASDDAIAKARADLSTNLGADPASQTNLFSPIMMCGPGLWDILKSSPHFAKPPVAKSTVEVPVGKDKAQKLPMALLQSEDEVASFRKALADLIKSQGNLTIREPTKDEFMVFWRVIPFDKITGPMLVAEGKDITIFFEFEKGKVFLADEVKPMHLKK
jgi:hypothetical protein